VRRPLAAEALIEAYRSLAAHGLNDAFSGNASLRDEKGFWITRTGCPGDRATEDDFVFCLWDAPLPAQASFDAPVHLAIYREIERARCVLHAHCPHAVALTMHRGDFLPEDLEGRLFLGECVRVVDVPLAEHRKHAPRLVVEASQQTGICIVRRHGAYAWAETIELAAKRLFALESAARIVWLARALR